MRVYVETYGCTANRVDAEIMMGLAEAAGHEIVETPESADILILNTCAVKGTTYRRMLHRIEQLGRNGKKLIVAGCLPLIDPKAIQRTGNFTAVISCRSIGELPEVLARVERGEARIVRQITDQIEKPVMPKRHFSHVSVAIPIAEGCTSACTYCAVRLARGRLRSYSRESIVKEARKLISSGYREILLTAQDTAAYGADKGGNLPELISAIASIPGSFRIRVGMMNPSSVIPILDDLIGSFRSEKVYRFLHLPVQSGDDRILKMMGRNYTVDDFLEIVNRFRSEIPDMTLCTDIIVGFPGEGEEEFENTKRLVFRVRPDKVNISRFSPMPGTPAASMPQLDGRIVCVRSRGLHKICLEIGMERNKKYVGREVSGFVVESGEKGGQILRSEGYRQVVIHGAELGDFLRVRVTGARPTYLLGEVAG
jgi:MiaB-like tRNA modifying enzyme